jgi:deazaflavin-dependent oxidoreductase (nitroreductase family)
MPEERDWDAMNRPVIEEFRKNGGRVPSRKSPILLLTTKGARTGRARVTPLNYSRDGGRYVVMASKGGSPTHPDWYHNLLADPIATVEVDGERLTARARTSEGAERERLLRLHTSAMPFFGTYERQVKRRQIPVIVLEAEEPPVSRVHPRTAPRRR